MKARSERRIDQVQSVLTVVGLTLVALVVGQFVVLGGVSLLGFVGISVAENPTLELVVGTVLLQGVTFGGIALVWLRVRSDSGLSVQTRLPTRGDIFWMGGGLIVLLAVLWLSSTVMTAIGIESAANRVVELGRRDPTAFLLLIPLSFLLVDPGEEVLFRGVVQGTLRTQFSAAKAVVLASSVFAGMHLPSLQGDGKLVYIATVFVLAIVLGALYEYTGSIVVPAIAHGGYNAVQYAFIYMSSTDSIPSTVASQTSLGGWIEIVILTSISGIVLIYRQSECVQRTVSMFSESIDTVSVRSLNE